ncbi:MAG: hypothetical protein E7184_00190 [Erysipelotrichaceae bacterium]|nr:hypothetical protein [Erysipelotrichaceae bacterium]
MKKISKFILSSLLILGSIFTAGATAFSSSNASDVKAYIDLPGGLECDSSMNSTVYSISGPSTIDVSSQLTEEERIAVIRENFELSYTSTTCLATGNLSSSTHTMSSDSLVISETSDNNYSVSYEDVTKTVTLNVILDIYAPVIDGQLSYTINYDEELDIDELKSNLTAIDEVDGEVEKELVENNCTEKKLGTCTIVFSATDRSGNSSQVTINVIRVDTTDPIINGPATVSRYLSSDLNIEELLLLFTVTDNADVGLTAVLVTDNYTSNKGVPGQYEVVVKATDSSGNETTKTTVVSVIDDIKPTISGINEWTKAYNVTLTIDSILSELTYSDNYYTVTTDDVYIVSDELTGNANKPGSYKIVVNVTDGSNNVSDDYTITVTVSDEIPPVFWANGEFYVVVKPTTLLTEQNIAYVARELGMFDKTRTVEIDILQNDYVGNETVEGEYQVYLRGTYANGESTTGVVTFAVSETLGTVIIQGEEKPVKKSGWDKFVDGFLYVITFEWLVDLVVFVFNIVESIALFLWDIVLKLWTAVKWVWNKLF